MLTSSQLIRRRNEDKNTSIKTIRTFICHKDRQYKLQNVKTETERIKKRRKRITAHKNTRQLSYRKEDRAIRTIYGCPEKFPESSLRTQLGLLFPEICNGLLFRSIIRMCVQKLKFVALPVPCGYSKKFGPSLDTPTLPFLQNFSYACVRVYPVNHHHHLHRGAERSAVASRRCDLSPKRSVLCQLESISHRYSRVPADLINPCSERSTSSTPPVG